ncbi:MAG: hypothetical protein U1F43_15930 [Myxococcota bacterium]
MVNLMRVGTMVLGMAAAAGLAAACDSDDGKTEAKTLTYTGTMVNALDSSPLAGVEICIVSPTGIPCVTTGADGKYTLAGLPASTKVQATVTKADFYPVFASFKTRTTDFTIDAVLLRIDLVKLAFTAAGIDLDESKGAILVRAYDPALGLTSAVEGISGEVSPADSGDGPVYNSADSIPGDATSTSTSGTWAVVNLDAGTYQVKSSGDGRTCPGTFHWPGSNGADWIETPVRAGSVSYVYVDCPAD